MNSCLFIIEFWVLQRSKLTGSIHDTTDLDAMIHPHINNHESFQHGAVKKYSPWRVKVIAFMTCQRIMSQFIKDVIKCLQGDQRLAVTK